MLWHFILILIRIYKTNLDKSQICENSHHLDKSGIRKRSFWWIKTNPALKKLRYPKRFCFTRFGSYTILTWEKEIGPIFWIQKTDFDGLEQTKHTMCLEKKKKRKQFLLFSWKSLYIVYNISFLSKPFFNL